MSVDSWRKQVSTSDGCIQLFNSTNFKTELKSCLINLHQTSLKQINDHQHFHSIINLYRTIRNLSSIPAQAEWIIVESEIVININHYLNTVFLKLGQILSLSTSSNDEDECLVLLSDIIRAAFQILSNLSFHSFSQTETKETDEMGIVSKDSEEKPIVSMDSIHSVLWSQFSSFNNTNCLISWISDLHDIAQKRIFAKAHNSHSLLLQTNMDRVLEPICAFIHQFMVHHAEIWDESQSAAVTRAVYQIQMIDIHCFGNVKGYLYEKREAEETNDSSDDDSSSDDDDDDDGEERKEKEPVANDTVAADDEFNKWSHHEWIRKILPYFINSNGLLCFIETLDMSTCRLYYFGVSVEMLFELTEMMLIDIKQEAPNYLTNVKVQQQKMLHLIQHSLVPTFLKLFDVIELSMKQMIPEIFKKRMERSENEMLIEICQLVLEIISNVALISTSIQSVEERRKYQQDLLDHGGSVLVECLRMLQQEADEINEYCKRRKIRMEHFNEKYKATMAKILSFRVQILSTVSTLCSGNQAIQDFMREKGVIELLLNMTKVDRSTMFLKEWAIFGIKNITEGHAQNQQYIQSIKAQKVMQNEEMKEMGIEVTYDDISGTLKTKKVNKD